MARTRDVLLALLCVGFLFLVGVSQFGRFLSMTGDSDTFLSEATPVVETLGVETVIREDRREERRALWQDRLKDFVPTPVSVAPEAEATTSPSGVIPGEVLQCPTYQVYTGVLPRLYSFEAEGVRIFTSSAEIALVDGTNTVVVLPIRTAQTASGQYCLPTDVIGIATNGTLIRNNQAAAYGVFDAETVVGYALDGFPIYGRLTRRQLDVCGGRETPQGYQYHIADGEEILTCFRAVPAPLP